MDLKGAVSHASTDLRSTRRRFGGAVVLSSLMDRAEERQGTVTVASCPASPRVAVARSSYGSAGDQGLPNRLGSSGPLGDAREGRPRSSCPRPAAARARLISCEHHSPVHSRGSQGAPWGALECWYLLAPIPAAGSRRSSRGLGSLGPPVAIRKGRDELGAP